MYMCVVFACLIRNLLKSFSHHTRILFLFPFFDCFCCCCVNACICAAATFNSILLFIEHFIQMLAWMRFFPLFSTLLCAVIVFLPCFQIQYMYLMGCGIYIFWWQFIYCSIDRLGIGGEHLLLLKWEFQFLNLFWFLSSAQFPLLFPGSFYFHLYLFLPLHPLLLSIIISACNVIDCAELLLNVIFHCRLTIVFNSFTQMRISMRSQYRCVYFHLSRALRINNFRISMKIVIECGIIDKQRFSIRVIYFHNESASLIQFVERKNGSFIDMRNLCDWNIGQAAIAGLQMLVLSFNNW